MLQSDRSEHYGYDNRDRLTGMDRGDLLPDRSAVATPINSPLLDSNQQWTDLDRRGNWKDYRWTDSPSGTPALHQRTSTVNGVNVYSSAKRKPESLAEFPNCLIGVATARLPAISTKRRNRTTGFANSRGSPAISAPPFQTGRNLWAMYHSQPDH